HLLSYLLYINYFPSRRSSDLRELLSFLEKIDHFSFHVEVINVYEEMARQFWRKHQSIFQLTDDVHMLVVGYDAFGKQLISEAEKAFQKTDTKQTLQVTVLDDFPERTLSGSIEKVPFHIEKDSLEAVISAHERRFTHIFICLDEDYIDLMEGIELSEIFAETPIYMNFTDEHIEQTLMIATTKTEKSLYSAGMKQDILTKDYLNI